MPRPRSNSLVSYAAPPDSLLAQVVDELACDDPLVVAREPLRVAEVFRVAHAGHQGWFNPRPLQLNDDAESRAAIASRIEQLDRWLAENRVIYGVNTGYGGTGIYNKGLSGEGLSRLQEVLINGLLASGQQDTLPAPFVRASMLLRVVSTFSGVSGLRWEVMQTLLALLDADAIPIVPLKGSLTASGDLVPLAYVAAALQDVEDARVEVSLRGKRMPARQALRELNIEPIRLGAKEGLALVNSTSAAAGAGCCVSVQALNAYFLTMVLTGLINCVVRGTLQSYHPFISEVKPHAGQVYASRLIFNLMHSVSDRLLPKHDLQGFAPSDDMRVWQLTYPFRCAAQHLAPEFDVILGAFHDLEIEINSVSDNPLLLVDQRRQFAVSGGNFLGSTVARDMDKLKVSLHSLARLVHAQFKYLVRGIDLIVAKTEQQTISERFLATHIIPLTAHPSDSMGFQGVEIYMDALLSEMNQKVGPHSTTYLAAEMENQAIVSMGLAAARGAGDIAADVNYCLAGHLMATCQAFDLTTLPPEVVSDYEARQENAVIDNPRAEELGYLKPVYDFVRRECRVPLLVASARPHDHLTTLVERIRNLDLIRTIYPGTIRAALDDGAFEEHSSR